MDVGDRFAAPVEQPPTASARRLSPEDRRRLRTPLALALVLALVAGGLAWWWFVGRPTVDPSTRITTSAPSGGVQAAARPDEVVSKYLHAVAAGRFAEAASYGPTGPGSLALLTDAVGARAVERQPLASIKVAPADQTAEAVKVSYTAGGEPVQTAIKVQRQADGSWRLAQSTVTLRVDGRRSEGVGVLINGTRVDAVQLEVLPGYYEVTTGLPFIAYQPGTDVAVRSLAAAPEVKALTTVITPEGLDALTAAARASLDSCLASTVLDPPGCPFGGTIAGRASDVRWRLANDPWSTFSPTLQPGTATASATLTIATDVSFTTPEGSKSTQSPVNVARVAGELGVGTASDVKVVWHRQ